MGLTKAHEYDIIFGSYGNKSEERMNFFKQIKKSNLFADMSDKEIEDIFECLNARIVKHSARDIIVRPNDEMNEICVILDGNLVEFTVGLGGERKVISSKVDGDSFGTPQCFLESKKSSSFITAATEATLLYITAESLFSFENNPLPCQKKMLLNLVSGLCGKIVELQQNRDFMAIHGMRKKIASFIYEKYIDQGSLNVRLGVDRNGMAKYLNCSRPSMSREMIGMREEGIFDFRKDLIQIKDPERLRKIAQE